MGKGTVVGVLCGLGGIFVSMMMEGGNPASLLAPPALILIIVGSFGAAAAGMKLEHSIDALKAMSKAFSNSDQAPAELITRMTSYAEQARRDGILSLETLVGSEPDPFLREGLHSWSTERVSRRRERGSLQRSRGASAFGSGAPASTRSWAVTHPHSASSARFSV